MSKLVPMEEAARLLGISIDRLTEMRANNEIFGYRDGPNWKFKMTEVERVADDLGISLGGGDALDEPLAREGSQGFQISDSDKELFVEGLSGDSGSMDFTDELGFSKLPEKSGKGLTDDYNEMESVEWMEDSSTEIFSSGKDKSSGADASSGLSDIFSEPESIELELADSGLLGGSSSVKGKFRDDAPIIPSEENVTDDEEDLSFGASSIRLASGSSHKLMGSADSGNDDSVFDDDLADENKSPSDTGKMLGDDLSFSEDDLFSDELSLSNDSSGSGLSSDFTDSGDLVLDDSDSSSEIKLEGSGIDLSANDSGIRLAGDSDIGGGSDIYSLELPEDEDDLVVVDSANDDEFNLTPLADPLEEDESTGSQVIALEDSEIYADESSEGLMADDEFVAEPAMFDDPLGGGFDAGYAPGFAAAGVGGVAATPEAPYNIWHITSLALVAVLLSLGAMVGYGVCQNMWMPDDQIIGRSVLNFFLRMTGMG